MLRRTSLARQSDKRRSEQQAYDQAKQRAWDRDRGQCQAAQHFPDIPCHGQIDPHHVAPRSRYPEMRADVTNLVCCCRRHHSHIHEYPLEAREAGLLR